MAVCQPLQTIPHSRDKQRSALHRIDNIAHLLAPIHHSTMAQGSNTAATSIYSQSCVSVECTPHRPIMNSSIFPRIQRQSPVLKAKYNIVVECNIVIPCYPGRYLWSGNHTRLLSVSPNEQSRGPLYRTVSYIRSHAVTLRRKRSW